MVALHFFSADATPNGLHSLDIPSPSMGTPPLYRNALVRPDA
jgi:hypothetical protein